MFLMGGGKTFLRVFPSDRRKVSFIVSETLDFLHVFSPSLNNEILSDFRLVINELLYNAIIHGNNDDKEKMVQIRLQAKNGSVECVITDEGKGFDHKQFLKKVKDSLYKNSDENTGNDHGRGIMIALALTDKLFYNSVGNELTFIKELEQDRF